MPDRTIVVVTGGLRHPSSTRLLADRLTAATVSALGERGVVATVRVVDLREHATDIANNLVAGFAPPALQSSLDALTAADGVIAVSPIFNASYGGLFKSFFDVIDESSLVDKPVLIAATGGTPRHSLALEYALRPLFSYLRAVVVTTAVYASSEDWAAVDDDRPLRDRVLLAASQLADLVERYERPTPADPFALTTPFEDLLA